MAKILVVDDEPSLRGTIAYSLRRDGHEVEVAEDGEAALAAWAAAPSDLVILDVMLPKLDGLEVCRRLRRTSSVPIVMLTARNEEIDRVVGLEIGADDYVTKPFSMREVLARVKAMLRRRDLLREEMRQSDVVADEVFQIAGLTIDPGRRRIFRGGT